ncbi:hypothetical protein [Bradyrhizobium sp. USDA 3256]
MTMTMTHNSWICTLTIDTATPDAIQAFRKWLSQYGPPVPRRDSDVIAKYVSTMLAACAKSRGTAAAFRATRARPIITAPWRHDAAFEQEPTPLLAELSPQRRRQLNGLAYCAFGALIVLACIVTFVL